MQNSLSKPLEYKFVNDYSTVNDCNEHRYYVGNQVCNCQTI